MIKPFGAGAAYEAAVITQLRARKRQPTTFTLWSLSQKDPSFCVYALFYGTLPQIIDPRVDEDILPFLGGSLHSVATQMRLSKLS